MRCRGAPLRPSAPWAAGTIPWSPLGNGGRKYSLCCQNCGEAAVLPVPKFVLQAGPSFACEPLLERAMAAPGAPDSPQVYHLTGRLPSSCTSRPLRCLDGIPVAWKDDPRCPCLVHGVLSKLVQLGILSGQRTQEAAPRHSRVATISGHLARWSLLDGSRVRRGPPAKRGAET